MPKLEKGCGENHGSAALWRDGLKGEVVEVPGIMLPNSILLQPHFSNWRRKLSSADHVADLEPLTSEGNTTGQKCGRIQRASAEFLGDGCMLLPCESSLCLKMRSLME